MLHSSFWLSTILKTSDGKDRSNRWQFSSNIIFSATVKTFTLLFIKNLHLIIIGVFLNISNMMNNKIMIHFFCKTSSISNLYPLIVILPCQIKIIIMLIGFGFSALLKIFDERNQAAWPFPQNLFYINFKALTCCFAFNLAKYYGTSVFVFVTTLLSTEI